MKKALLTASAVICAGFVGFLLPSLSKGSPPSIGKIILSMPIVTGLGVLFFVAVYRGEKRRDQEHKKSKIKGPKMPSGLEIERAKKLRQQAHISIILGAFVFLMFLLVDISQLHSPGGSLHIDSVFITLIGLFLAVWGFYKRSKIGKLLSQLEDNR